MGAGNSNRKVSRRLILLLPATMIPLSLYGIAASFGVSLGALGAWTIGLGAALTLNGFVFLGPRGLRYDPVDGAGSRALRIDRIERLARGHEKAVALRTSKADVAAHFEQTNAAN